MTVATELAHLALADRRLAEGAERVRQQAELVNQLRDEGQDTYEADAFLRLLREILYSWQGYREQVLAAIARLEGEAELAK